MTTIQVQPKPAHPTIRVRSDAAPFVEGYRCDACGAAFQDQPLCCRRCAHRHTPSPFRAAATGRLYSWTVVERGYPGIAVPFVSAVVDLDDGLTLKGTLRDIDPYSVAAGLPVSLLFDDAGGAKDKEGTPYVGFHFVPRTGEAA